MLEEALSKFSLHRLGCSSTPKTLCQSIFSQQKAVDANPVRRSIGAVDCNVSLYSAPRFEAKLLKSQSATDTYRRQICRANSLIPRDYGSVSSDDVGLAVSNWYSPLQQLSFVSKSPAADASRGITNVSLFTEPTPVQVGRFHPGWRSSPVRSSRPRSICDRKSWLIRFRDRLRPCRSEARRIVSKYL